MDDESQLGKDRIQANGDQVDNTQTNRDQADSDLADSDLADSDLADRSESKQRFLRIASPYERVGGSMLDTIVLLVAFLVWDYVSVARMVGGNLGIWVNNLALPLGVFIYNWLWVAFKGATPGKRVLGTRVVRQSDGGQPNFREAALRASLYLVVLIPVGGAVANILISLVGFALLFSERNCRTLMDMLAGTVVIDESELDADVAAERLGSLPPIS